MSNDHKANIKDSFANKAGEAKKGAVPDSHDKLVQARLNREVDATLNQAKILLDSEPKNSAAKKPEHSFTEHKHTFDNSRNSASAGKGPDPKLKLNQNSSSSDNSSDRIKDDTKKADAEAVKTEKGRTFTHER